MTPTPTLPSTPLATMQRARAKLPLTPGERAWLKLAEGLALTAVLAALVTAGHALEGSGPVDWQRVGFAAGVAALVAVLNALAKYFTAQGDAPLADALTLLASEAAARGETSTASIPAPGQPTTLGEAAIPVISAIASDTAVPARTATPALSASPATLAAQAETTTPAISASPAMPAETVTPAISATSAETSIAAISAMSVASAGANAAKVPASMVG